MSRRAALLGLLAALTQARQARSAEGYSEDAVKAAFLFRFAGYVEWPPEALSSGVFTIAVLGSDAVAAELQRLLPGHELKGLPAQVRRIDSVRNLGAAQMLYIGAERQTDVRDDIIKIASRPVLVITDVEGGLDEGSAVNFLLVDRRVRFEISLAAADRAGLRISSELLSVAARVQGRGLRSEAICPDLNRELGTRCGPRVA